MNEPNACHERPSPAKAVVIYLCTHSARAAWMTPRDGNPHRAIVRAMTEARPLPEAIGLSGLAGCADVVLPAGWCLHSVSRDTDQLDFETEIDAGVRYSWDDQDIAIDAVIVCDVDILPLLPEGEQKAALLRKLEDRAQADSEFRVDDRSDLRNYGNTPASYLRYVEAR